MSKKKSARWVALFLTLVLTVLAVVGGLTALVDPYFLYHKPLSGIHCLLNNERYQNYGIARNFDYDAVIVGTSMSENFKPSELDAIFGVKSVKLPFSGGSHREVKELLDFAFAHNSDIKCVVRNIDLFRAFDGKDDRDYPEDSYPQYLYDDNPWNDVGYLLNMETFMEGTMQDLIWTLLGRPAQTLDEYANWNDQYVFGPQGIQQNYSRDKVVYTGNNSVTEEETVRIRENITENVLQAAKDHPDTMFYIYVSPYSIYFFDYINQMGELDRYLDAQEIIIRLLLGQENIRLFAFYTEYTTVCNPYNYRDVAHHDESINSMILKWISQGHDELTEENCQEYFDEVRSFYHSYDYDSLFEEDGYTIKEPASNLK